MALTIRVEGTERAVSVVRLLNNSHVYTPKKRTHRHAPFSNQIKKT